MNKSYTQVIKQIETLKAEAEKLRRKEMDGVITRIREAIDFYQLTASDLGLSGARAGKSSATKAEPKNGRRKTREAKPPAQVRFRDEQGNTWVGRGKRPQWLRDALDSGKKLEDFAAK